MTGEGTIRGEEETPRGGGRRKTCGKRVLTGGRAERGATGRSTQQSAAHTFQEATTEPLVLGAILNNNF